MIRTQKKAKELDEQHKVFKDFLDLQNELSEKV